MKLQILSDLHLEFDPEFYPPKTADNIALLGDIGYPHTTEYQLLINKLSADYLHVFVITGNHEYYRRQKTYEYINNLLRTFCESFNNVHFLNNSHFILDNLRIVGTTLWSDIPLHLGFSTMSCMNDYRQIRKYAKFNHKSGLHENIKVNISFSDTNKWHKAAVSYIEEQIQEAKEHKQKVVVLTHHAPTFNGTTGPESTEKLKHSFATDLDHLLKDPIVAWLYGHTHHSTNFVNGNGVRIASNQRGYPTQETNFQPDFHITL